MIGVSIGITVACVVLGAITFAVSGCIDLRDSWRHARAVIEQTEAELSDQPVPYWPAETIDALATMISCQRCQDRPGLCECSAYCGHLDCTGGFDPADLEYMERLFTPEGTDQ